MKYFKIFLFISFALFTSFTFIQSQESLKKMMNPLLVKSTLQYQAPRFDLIRNEHFKPAFIIGLARHMEEINAITNNTDRATFENTVLALELSGADLKRAMGLFYNLTSSNTNPALQELQKEYAPIFSAHFDKIYLNSNLYQKIKAIDLKSLEGEDKRLTEYYLQEFELAGAGLDDAQKSEMKKINEELATTSTLFNSKLLTARNNGAVFFENKSDLDGLSEQEIEAAFSAAKEAGKEGQYMISIINTTQQPILQYLHNRNSREKIFKSSLYRSEKNDDADTRELVKQIAKLRLQKAKLMGKKNYASWRIQDQMAKTSENAMSLLQEIALPAVQKAKQEAEAIQKMIDEKTPGVKLEAWDWNYYSEQVRKAKYDIDESEIKPYFELMSVLENGVFFAAKQMYGITFKKRDDLPVYHPDVVAYEVFNEANESIALYYLDFYTRDNKSGGAWMDNFIPQSHVLKQKPVIVNVFNFVKPLPDQASLISFDDVITTFHEFGHSLHGLFADQKYVSLSGTSVPRDYVEFPSQINEHAALDPTVLKNYALHYKTKEVIPQTLLDKMKRAETFNKGYEITELLAAAILDLEWHSIENENQITDVLEFEKNALKKNNILMNEVPSRYRTPYFAHIWGGGYSSGYYAYTWSKTLDYNAFDWMKANGGMSRENCERFKKYILSVGNSVDLNKAFEDFIGKKMSIEPYLINAGLK